MNLHQIKYTKDGEARQEFSASEGAASKRSTELKKDKGVKVEGREPVEIPTDKTGLLAWLNTNATYAVAE